MSQRTVTIVTCDQCPEDNSRPVLDTYRLSFNGTDYETELCAEHKVALDNVLGPVITSARRISGRTGGFPKRDRHSETAEFRKAARAWGIANGRPVSAMGRVSETLLTEYRQHVAGLGHEKSPSGLVA